MSASSSPDRSSLVVPCALGCLLHLYTAVFRADGPHCSVHCRAVALVVFSVRNCSDIAGLKNHERKRWGHCLTVRRIIGALWSTGGRVRTAALAEQSGNRPSPHDSRRLLLQPPYAVATGLTADGLAAQSVNILFKYASLLRGSARPSRMASRRFRHELS